MSRRLMTCILMLGGLTAMPHAQQGNPFPLAIDAEAEVWVQRTLDSLTLEQMIGQMLCSHVPWGSPDRPDEFEAQADMIADLEMGGIIVGGRSCEAMLPFINRAQSRVDIPLLVCADFESGVGRIWSDATRVPALMAIAATGDPGVAREAGAITAREARAAGVHWLLSPVCDVNINPANPIINIRSFGEDVETVSRMATAYIEGAQANGALTCAKHFPGHGDTSQDSHIELAVVEADLDRLEAVEFPPFQAAVNEGVASVMTSHVYFPALMGDEGRIPATVSPNVMTGLLRERMRFDGLIVTDSMRMHGITTHYGPGEAAVRTVQSGIDMVLVSADYEEARAALLDAVRAGELSEEQIRLSVERILRAKAWVGLQHGRHIEVEDALAALERPETRMEAHGMFRRAITLVRDERGVLPIRPDNDLQVAHIALFDDSQRWRPEVIDPLTHGLSDRYGTITREMVFGEPDLPMMERFFGELPPGTNIAGMTPHRRESLMDLAERSDAVIITAYVRIAAYQGDISLDDEMIRFLHEVTALDKPVVLVSLGSPYLLTAVPDAPCMVATFDYAAEVAHALTEAISGQAPITGTLPVTLPGVAPFGAGVQLTGGEAR